MSSLWGTKTIMGGSPTSFGYSEYPRQAGLFGINLSNTAAAAPSARIINPQQQHLTTAGSPWLRSSMRKAPKTQSTANTCAFGYSPLTGSQSATCASATRWTVDIYISDAALAMVADEDIFVMSQGRSGYSEVRYDLDTTLAGGPLEVVRIAPRGTVLWRTTLPASVKSEQKNNCMPQMTRAENGDLLVSCAFGGRLDLYRLDRRTGTFRHAVATLPDCAGPYASIVFVAEMNSDIVLVGTLPPNSSLRPGELRCSFRGTIRADSLN